MYFMGREVVFYATQRVATGRRVATCRVDSAISEFRVVATDASILGNYL